MSVRDLIPWGRSGGEQVPSTFQDRDRDPFLSLHREVNRLFDDAFRSFDSRLPSFGRHPLSAVLGQASRSPTMRRRSR